jgi:nucleoside-diphosphate-sugar epimerase
MTKALNGEPPMIHGDGRQSRDFIFVSDVVQALIASAISPSAPGQVFNAGAGKSVAINHLWELIAALSGTQCRPLNGPQRAGDVPHSVSDISAARAHLAFAPRVNFKTGLERTMEWYRTAPDGR